MKSAGQLFYEYYEKLQFHLNGIAIPSWHDLPEGTKRAFDEAAQNLLSDFY